MRSFVILVLAVSLAAFAFGCASKQQFRSNVHSGNVEEWMVPASQSPTAVEIGGKIVAVGVTGRMLDRATQMEKAAQIAILKIRERFGPEIIIVLCGPFTDRDGNIFIVARQEK